MGLNCVFPCILWIICFGSISSEGTTERHEAQPRGLKRAKPDPLRAIASSEAGVAASETRGRGARELST